MLKIGSITVGKMFLGSTGIAKAYLGSTLVFQNAPAPVPIAGDVTVVPSSYDTVNSHYQSASNIGNGYTNSSSTSYAQIGLTRGSGAATDFYYKFDFSAIPANATITSVSVKTKTYISQTNTSRVATRGQNVCKGTTPVGENTTISTTATVRELDAGNAWTRAELDALAVHLYATRGTSNVDTSYYFRFYGAEVTVEYTYFAN